MSESSEGIRRRLRDGSSTSPPLDGLNVDHPVPMLSREIDHPVPSLSPEIDHPVPILSPEQYRFVRYAIALADRLRSDGADPGIARTAGDSERRGVARVRSALSLFESLPRWAERGDGG